MKFATAISSLAITAALLQASAVAQTRFCIGGDLDHLSASDRAACSATMQAVRTAATRMHEPQDWHFVVVCGEEGWTQYAAFSSRGVDAVANDIADTNLEEHTTYLRESRLQAPQPRSLERAVAHELAVITLQSHDEAAIQSQVAAWERSSLTQTASLTR